MLTKQLLRNWIFMIGVALLVAGTGPLLAIMLAGGLGLTADPNPNPVAFGMLAGLTFWPAVILIVIGFVKSYRSVADDRKSS